MRIAILARITRGHKPRPLAIGPGDLLCPQTHCRAICQFSSAGRWIGCVTCGWMHLLAEEEHATLVAALAGSNEIDLPAYLLGLLAAPAPTSVDTAPL